MKLGELIQQVREIVPYNPDLPIKGLSSEKCFVDIEIKKEGLENKKFQLVKKDQFCYGAGHLCNFGRNILIAHNEIKRDLALSTTYTVFEIINSKILLPKYLMIWFSRDKFNYLVHWFAQGSHLELFSWQNLCNLSIRVPPPVSKKN